MAKKPLGKDKFGVQKVMRTKDYLGDSLAIFTECNLNNYWTADLFLYRQSWSGSRGDCNCIVDQ